MSDTSYVSEGCLLDYTPASAVSAGDIVFVGSMCGQVVSAVGASEQGALRVEGVIRVAKQSATVFANGDPVHWDSGNTRASTSAVSGLMGVAVGGGADGQTYVDVRLNAGGVGSNGVLAAAQQALSGAGAINVTTYYTAWTTTGANAGTLANGTYVGQQKKIKQIVDGGDGTLTPVNLANGTTITFADAGDYVVLVWNGSDWVPVEMGNDADGATQPTLA